MKIIGIVSAIFGLAVVITSSLILYDAISHKTKQYDLYHSPYLKYGYDVFWDKFKFDDDILIILGPLTLLVGLVQMIVPMTFVCKEPKDPRKVMIIWLGTNCVLVFMALSCFVLGLVYRIDQNGIKTYHYDGRSSNTYLSSWWSYDKGQAYLGVLGCNVAMLVFTIVWIVRWMTRPEHGSPIRYEYKYERGNGDGTSSGRGTPVREEYKPKGGYGITPAPVREPSPIPYEYKPKGGYSYGNGNNGYGGGGSPRRGSPIRYEYKYQRSNGYDHEGIRTSTPV